jgi:predicted transcriptional regulator
MALIRPIRLPPVKPTPEKLRRFMQDYGITRKSVARLMRCSEAAVSRYLMPAGSPLAQPIPLARFELFLLKTRAIFHPDEEFELPL